MRGRWSNQRLQIWRLDSPTRMRPGDLGEGSLSIVQNEEESNIRNVGCQEKGATSQKNPLVRAREKFHLRR